MQKVNILGEVCACKISLSLLQSCRGVGSGNCNRNIAQVGGLSVEYGVISAGSLSALHNLYYARGSTAQGKVT